MRVSVDVEAQVGTLRLAVAIEVGDAPVAIIGPNGSGKSTLLRVLVGAEHATRGLVRVGERTLYDSERGVDCAPEARDVGYVPQGSGLFPHLSVMDNVAFGLAARRVPREARSARVLEALGELGVAHLAERLPERLSGGELQRVALARALVTRPSLLLLDEPLAAMDARARRALRRALAERLAGGCPALVVSHDQADVAALGATVCVLSRGKVVQRGSLAALRAAPHDDFVAEFCGLE